MIYRCLYFLIFVTIRHLVLFVQGEINRGKHMKLPQTVLNSRAQQRIDSLVIVELDFSLGRMYIDIYMLGVYLQVEKIFWLFALLDKPLKGTYHSMM